MHYYPSTYNELIDCVVRTKHKAEQMGLRPVSMVIGEFQHRMVRDEATIRTMHPEYHAKAPEFCGVPFDVRGSYGFDMKVG